jgi:hypothetical protein
MNALMRENSGVTVIRCFSFKEFYFKLKIKNKNTLKKNPKNGCP